MGLRDRLKGLVKDVLRVGSGPSSPHGPDARPAPPAPVRPAAPARPAPAVAPEAPAAPVAAAAPPAPEAAPEAVEAPKAEARGKGKARKARETREAAAPAAEWTAVGPASSVREGKAATWAHKHGVIAVFRHNGRLYAVDNACRHEDGPVGEGEINGCLVKCPYHDWEYDYTTGQSTSNPGNALTTWQVEEREGQIWIGPVLHAGTDERGGEHNDGLKVITQ